MFDVTAFEPLRRNPGSEIVGNLDGIPFSARIAIPRYDVSIARHYRDVAPDGLSAICAEAAIPFDLPHFGLALHFARPVEVSFHDKHMVLDESIRALVARFGPVILHNAQLGAAIRGRFHRNIFPHLRFHVDRAPLAENQYSCFTRDPRDPDQRAQRASSTLFIANIVSWLERARDAGGGMRPPIGVTSGYCELFDGQSIAPLLGEIILEQPWIEPDGTGEICVIDNRTVLHATYHKDGRTEGYPIGTRYLF